MKSKKILISLALLVAVVCLVAGCGAKSAVSSTAATIKVGTEDVITLYSAVGERAITKGTVVDGKTEVTYGGGNVSIDDLNAYITKLVNENDFIITKNVSTDEAGGQSYQIGKNATDAGKIVYIDFYFVADGNTVVTYSQANGSI